MTDRLKGLVVTFDHDMREDDAEVIVSAIRQLRGVISVKPVIGNIDDEINRERVRLEMRAKLLEALK